MKVAQGNHSLLTEVAYVQKQNQEERSRFLRALISKVSIEHEDSIASAKANVVLSSASALNQTHKDILLQALGITTSIFAIHTVTDSQQPLWSWLLKKNLGLRLVSVDFKDRSDKLLRAFSLQSCDELTNLTMDPFLAYRLANFNRSTFLASLAQGNVNTELTLRIKIRLTPSLNLNHEITHADLDEKTKNSLLASLIVNMMKSKIPRDGSMSRITENLENFLTEAPKKPFDTNQLLTEIHIMNSLCYYDLAQNNISQVQIRLKKLEEQYLPILKKVSLSSMRHVLGNMYLHKSLLSGSVDAKLGFLLRALKYDRNFYDSYYRIAQICHDVGNDLAKPYYEAALAYSPMPWEVLNDYGVLLNDLGDRGGVESLEALVETLGVSDKKL